MWSGSSSTTAASGRLNACEMLGHGQSQGCHRTDITAGRRPTTAAAGRFNACELLVHAQGRLARVLTSPETKRFRPGDWLRGLGYVQAKRRQAPQASPAGGPRHWEAPTYFVFCKHLIAFGPPCTTCWRSLARQILPEPSGVVSAGGLCSRSPFPCWPECKECLCTGFTYKDILRRLGFNKCRWNFHTVLWPGSMSMGRFFRCVQPGFIP